MIYIPTTQNKHRSIKYYHGPNSKLCFYKFLISLELRDAQRKGWYLLLLCRIPCQDFKISYLNAEPTSKSKKLQRWILIKFLRHTYNIKLWNTRKMSYVSYFTGKIFPSGCIKLFRITARVACAAYNPFISFLIWMRSPEIKGNYI